MSKIKEQLKKRRKELDLKQEDMTLRAGMSSQQYQRMESKGKPWAKQQKLHPVLFSLFPEGALRDYLAQALKTHTNNEFELFAYLGRDLPDALIATAMRLAELAGIGKTYTPTFGFKCRDEPAF